MRRRKILLRLRFNKKKIVSLIMFNLEKKKRATKSKE